MRKQIKGIIVAVAFVFAGLTADAQIYIGPKAGINLASLSTNEAGFETSSLMGIHGGLTFRWQFAKQWSMGVDALYSQMGGKKTLQTTNAGSVLTEEYTTHLDYAQVPLYINFEVPLNRKNLIPYRVKESMASFHAYGGGYFGYGLGAKQSSEVKIENNDGTAPVITTTDKADIPDPNFSAIDFGIAAGMGFSFKLDEEDKSRLVVDARYMMGLANTAKYAANGIYPDGIEQKNSAIQASITYQYKLTKRKYTPRY